jgi:signal transduction histidine kinase/CheY-like chemotaxis protein
MRIPFSRPLYKAFRAGAGPSLDPRRAKRIILSNQIALSLAFLSSLYVLIYLATGARLMGWLEIPIALGYASVALINLGGRDWLARAFLITLANLDILGYTLFLGTDTSQHLFFLLAGWAPLVLFDWGERKTIVYGILISSALLLGAEAFAPAKGLVERIADGDLPRMRLTQVATMQIVEFLLIFYFFRGNRRTEMALALAGEAARTADEAKGRFLTRMSGAIRSPLAEIISLSRLLLKSGLGPERNGTLEDMRMAASDLMAIVDELVDLSRIEAGRMSLAAAPFAPLRLGHQVLRPFEIESARKGLDLSLEADPGMPSLLSGDAARLKQVLRNLVGNACKFTDAGKVVLRMRYEAGGTPGPSFLHCEIEDTGIGIPEAARATLFEPFAQADASTTRNYGGTGLGLFISKQIVELMGGGIGFRPGPEKGTVFHFRVPLPIAPIPSTAAGLTAEADSGAPEAIGEEPEAEADGPEPRAEAEAEKGRAWIPIPEGPGPQPGIAGTADGEPPPGTGNLRVLVVDDHPMNRKLLVQFLAGYGILADTAASGQEALDACAAKGYHAVFLDCHMPGMDGYACARRLCEGPASVRPILIGVTADSSETALRRCLEAGMDDLLPKPILERRLRAIVAECARRLV